MCGHDDEGRTKERGADARILATKTPLKSCMTKENVAGKSRVTFAENQAAVFDCSRPTNVGMTPLLEESKKVTTMSNPTPSPHPVNCTTPLRSSRYSTFTMATDYDPYYFSRLENGYDSGDYGLYIFDSAKSAERSNLDARVHADVEFQRVFGYERWKNTSQRNRRLLWEIKNNCPGTVRFRFSKRADKTKTDDWNSEQWKQLGIYLGRNTHAVRVDLDYCMQFPPATRLIPFMFEGLKDNKNIKSLSMTFSSFDIESIGALIPFLANNPSLLELDMRYSTGITPEIFGSLIRALHNGRVESLDFYACSLGSIIQMEGLVLPHLRHLVLGDNGLTDEDCRVLSEFIKCEGSRLEYLSIAHNKFGDEGAEYFAESLRTNTSLKKLYLAGDETRFTEIGVNAFSKVLSDVSSVKATYASNHSLRELGIDSGCVRVARCPRACAALSINAENVGNPHLAGRRKIIAFQLSSEARRKMSELQGVEDFRTRPFDEMDLLVLPNALSLIGMNHGWNELYQGLLGNFASLLSLAGKYAKTEEQLAKIEPKAKRQRKK